MIQILLLVMSLNAAGEPFISSKPMASIKECMARATSILIQTQKEYTEEEQKRIWNKTPVTTHEEFKASATCVVRWVGGRDA